MYKSAFIYKNEKITFFHIKGYAIKETAKFNEYFKKLDIKPTKLTLKLVKKIQQKHLETFSFNNIAVLLNKPISLDIDDILEKIVTKNLGGYCFEHNKLLHDALLFLGFDVRISLARVLNNAKVDSPKTHRITLLKFKGEEYLLDVGFGAMTPTVPLKLSDKNINNNYKIVKKTKNDFVVEMAKKEKCVTLYTFNDALYTEADCKMGNFYSEQHPDAVFQNNLVISLKKKNKILSYRNNSYHQISKKFTNILNVIDHNELQDILENDFGINISKKDIKILFKLAEEFRIA